MARPSPQALGRLAAVQRRRARAHASLQQAAATSSRAMRCHAAQRRMAARLSQLPGADLEALAAEVADLGREDGPQALAQAVAVLAAGG